MDYQQKHIEHPMSLLDLTTRQEGRYAYDYNMNGTSSTIFSDFNRLGNRHFHLATVQKTIAKKGPPLSDN